MTARSIPKRRRKRNAKRLSDPVLLAIRAARAARDEANADYAELCLGAIESGYSYRKVAHAATIDVGALHRYLAAYKKRVASQPKRGDNIIRSRPAKIPASDL